MLVENNPYPQDIRVHREAITLTEAGYEVTVISPRQGHQPWLERIEGVHVHRFPAPPEGNGKLAYLLEYGYALIAIFCLSIYVWLRRGINIVHIHNPPDLLALVGLFYKLMGKSIIFDHHDLAPEMYEALFGTKEGMVYRALRGFERLMCGIADHVIETNESYQKIDMARNRVPAKQITIVRNGPDLSYLKPIAPDPSLSKPGKTMICYVGDMGFHDGIDYLLRALHVLIYDMEQTALWAVLVGDGSAYTAMQTMSKQLELEPYVTFTGRVPHHDVVRYISSADICVAPEPANSYNDRSTMIKIMEYMAVGKPIVAFDLAEHRVSAANAALYATPNDERDFAKQIALLIENPTLGVERGNYGRTRAEQTLAWPHQAQKLLTAYGSIDSRSNDIHQTMQASSADEV